MGALRFGSPGFFVLCSSMKVLNIHTRKLAEPRERVLALLTTLSSENDRIWPDENWPKMRFEDGMKTGSDGGHGPIRYKLVEYNPNGNIVFNFQKPVGFNGIHKLEVSAIDSSNTEIRHTIDMTTTGTGTFLWSVAIGPLHNALIEDAFDKIQDQFGHNFTKSKWSLWVRVLRAVLK